MSKGYSSGKEPYCEPPSKLSINSAAPNRNQLLESPEPRVSSSLSEEGSPKSYLSYSSAAYSSVGEGDNGLSHGLDSISKAKAFRTNSLHQASSDHINNNESVAGYGLLSEVLKMQSLLEEYQQALTVLEVEKADKQQEISRLEKMLKGKGETEERYKDEIWNLEISNQELLQKVNDLSQQVSRFNNDQTRFAREEIRLSQELEQLKTARHLGQTEVQKLKEQHDQDIINYKKALHTLRSEKDSISKQLQEYISQKQNESMNQPELRHVESYGKGAAVKEGSISSFSDKETPPDSHMYHKINEKKASIYYEAEVATLKMSLEQTHRIIKSMQDIIDKERAERVEVDQLLREAQETIENFNHHTSIKTTSQWLPESNTSSKCSSRFNSPKKSMKRQHMNVRATKTEELKSISSKSGISLCDELSKVGSIAAFPDISIEDITTDNIEGTVSSSSNPMFCKNGENDMKDDSGETLSDAAVAQAIFDDNNKTITGETEEMNTTLKSVLADENEGCKSHTSLATTHPLISLETCALPSICNHEIFEPEELQEIVRLENVLSNHEFYGSLTIEPRSYMYKSIRESSKTKLRKEKAFSPINLNFSDNFSVNAQFDDRKVDIKEECGENSIKAMTRAMIGDWMWKYTKRVVGFGKLEKHRRFFWIHPYSQTLYWSTKEPGTKSIQSGTKSVLIESFSIGESISERNKPPCIFVKTPSKRMQIQCLDFDAHYAWMKTFHYLLNSQSVTPNLLPTKVLPENGKVILDGQKFSSLRQGSKILKQTQDDANKNYDSSDNEKQPVYSGHFSEPISAILNNSTLINLSFKDDNFQQQTLLDFAAIK